jgi:hypothetical protein
MLAMRRIYTTIGISLIFLAVVSLGCLCSTQVLIWDGGYLDAEYQITFKDQTGQPVEGIELRIEDREGHVYHHYPVTDFLPGVIPTSDKNGLMVFHHLCYFPIEFSGRIRYVFFLFPVEEKRGPEYICRFSFKGNEVYRVPYGDVNGWREGTWEEVAKVKRNWRFPDWPASELGQKNDESYEAWASRINAFFDKNKNGQREPEEAAAQNAFSWYLERKAMARHRGEDKGQEVEFPLVKKTISIEIPR